MLKGGSSVKSDGGENHQNIPIVDVRTEIPEIFSSREIENYFIT